MATVPGQLVTSRSQADPHCWICLNCINHQNHYSSTSFQMLMRYLGVDLLRLWGDSFQNKLNKENMCLCEGCSLKVEEFWNLYQDFEAFRLSLDDCAQDVCNLIQASEGKGNEQARLKRGRQTWNNVVTTEITTLRRETLKMCYFRTRSVPRVQLQKLPAETPPTKNPIADLIFCNYCSYSAHLPSTIKDHMVLQHTMEFYSSQIPAGTSNAQLSVATNATVEEHLAHPKNHDNDNSKFLNCASCQSCQNDRNMLKMHILKEHFDEVITTLNEITMTSSTEQDEETPSPTDEDEDMYEDNDEEVQTSSTHFENPSVLQRSTKTYQVKIVKKRNKKPVYASVYKCAICKTNHHSRKLLQSHIKAVHKYFPCKYCDTVYLCISGRKCHMTLQHTFLFHKNKLPDGTLEEEMNEAIESALVLKGIKLEDTTLPHKCPHCEKSFRLCHIKRHVLRVHFKAVIKELLKRKKHSKSTGFTQFESSSAPIVKEDKDQNEAGPTISTNLEMDIDIKFEPIGRSFNDSEHDDDDDDHESESPFEVSLLKIETETKPAPASPLLVDCTAPEDCNAPENYGNQSLQNPLTSTKFRCAQCKTRHSSKKLLRQHIISNHEYFPCQHCSALYLERKDLRDHLMSKHSFFFYKNKLPSGISEEEWNKAVQKALVRHVIESEDATARHKCPHCKKTLNREIDLLRHVLRKHFQVVNRLLKNKEVTNSQRPNADRPTSEATQFVRSALQKLLFRKRVTSAQIKRSKARRNQLYQQTNPDKPLFACQYCDKTYRKNEDRKFHMILHHTFLFFQDNLPPGTTEEELYNALKKAFDRIDTYKDPTDAGHQCPGPDCERRFTSSYKFKLHILHQHFHLVTRQLLQKEKPAESTDELTNKSVSDLDEASNIEDNSDGELEGDETSER